MTKLTYERKSRTKAATKQALRSAKEQTETLVELVLSAGKPATTAATAAPNAPSGPRPHQVIKLGVDVHLDRYVVVRQIAIRVKPIQSAFSEMQNELCAGLTFFMVSKSN